MASTATIDLTDGHSMASGMKTFLYSNVETLVIRRYLRFLAWTGTRNFLYTNTLDKMIKKRVRGLHSNIDNFPGSHFLKLDKKLS